jgi:hypothetical protein
MPDFEKRSKPRAGSVARQVVEVAASTVVTARLPIAEVQPATAVPMASVTAREAAAGATTVGHHPVAAAEVAVLEPPSPQVLEVEHPPLVWMALKGSSSSERTLETQPFK